MSWGIPDENRFEKIILGSLLYSLSLMDLHNIYSEDILDSFKYWPEFRSV